MQKTTHTNTLARAHTDASTAAADSLPSSENGYHFVTMRFGTGVKGDAPDRKQPEQLRAGGVSSA